MNKIHHFVTSAALIAGLTGTLFVASTGAAVGERYFGAALDFVDVSDAQFRNERGETFVFNTPLNDRFDLSAQYSYLYTRDRATREKYSGHQGFFSTTYAFASDGPKPYLRAGLGWVNINVPGPDSNDWLYATELGLELPVQRVVFTPYLSYVDGFRRRVDGTFEVGVRGEAKLSRALSLVGGVARDDDHDWGYKAGVLVRF